MRNEQVWPSFPPQRRREPPNSTKRRPIRDQHFFLRSKEAEVGVRSKDWDPPLHGRSGDGHCSSSGQELGVVDVHPGEVCVGRCPAERRKEEGLEVVGYRPCSDGDGEEHFEEGEGDEPSES